MPFSKISERFKRMIPVVIKKTHYLFHSISTKVILVIIILVLPLNLSAMAANDMAIRTMVEQARLSAQNLADTNMTEIAGRMENTLSLLYYFLTEDSDLTKMKLQEEASYDYWSSKYRFFHNLKNMASMTDGGDGYFYYMKKIENLVVYGSSSDTGKASTRINELLMDQLEYGIQGGWHIYVMNTCQYLVLIINAGDVAYGGWINLDMARADLEKGLDYTDYGISFSEEEEAWDGKEIISVSTLKKGIWLNININRTEILGGISFYHKFLRVLFWAYLILIPVLYVFLHFLLLKPLSNVNHAHRQVQKGNQDFRIQKRANSVEYREAYQSFNQMADNLKSLKIENYEKEIAKQRMELRNLQLQIRPHFLLNTFNLVYTLAQRKDFDAIHNIIIYLSNYFRYIARSGKELELFPKELELIKGYMDMASIRYAGLIEFQYEFDPEIMLVRTPPLLLHNFMENAVKYGVRQGKILHVSFLGSYWEKVVTFSIADDGNGMDEKTLERNRKLLNEEVEPENPDSHIGLFNSLKRLKYFYGEEAGIEVSSEPGKRTCFQIRIPYNLEVDDETFDGQ